MAWEQAEEKDVKGVAVMLFLTDQTADCNTASCYPLLGISGPEQRFYLGSLTLIFINGHE
ncbi:hypothetical protein N7457_007475 [Penicillium paradoxum]|uniref:uncharacterized protein n=1 Tax=Penicillium paradoxum TaxID=176176 RepID=UPI0025493634|nr:uncharacterized protein N7457_007475 [Penicillium paradoxum]KAJ5779755.1 hypothetical protein N7457_007475 [Penicillium paradoxum]